MCACDQSHRPNFVLFFVFLFNSNNWESARDLDLIEGFAYLNN